MSYSILEQPDTWTIDVPNHTIVFSTKYKLSLDLALELLGQLKVNREEFLDRHYLQLPTDPLRLPLHIACCVNKHHNNINEDNECFENMISTLEKSTTELKRLIYLEEFKQEFSGILVEKELIRILFELYFIC
jgi:hypothetical protein